jgi:hypothetical protein
VARQRLTTLAAIVLVVAPFFLPWPFLPPPHGTRFYEIVAQVFPVLVLAWVIELRGSFWSQRAGEPGLTAITPWADLVMFVLGEGAALYAVGYGVSNGATFTLTAGPLVFFGSRVIIRGSRMFG